MGEIAIVGNFCSSAVSVHLVLGQPFVVTYLSANHIFHSRMKYLTIDYHFVHDFVQLSKLCVVNISVGDQLTNTLTKISISVLPLLLI